ncbi:MAG TPA: SHOCT domain-containing protein [candidate division Zixibacteria bacterium]|nr:SHOCT domain-containing protein [candidate division Zixibacteria bacterium]
MLTGFGMGLSGFGFVFMALFWLVIIGLGIWLLSNLFPKGDASSQSQESSSESALEILRKRYARGELTKEDFESMRYEIES